MNCTVGGGPGKVLVDSGPSHCVWDQLTFVMDRDEWINPPKVLQVRDLSTVSTVTELILST